MSTRLTVKRGFEAVATTVIASLAVATPAQAVPPVDPDQDYVDPECLDHVEQPGVVEYRDMLLSRVGGESGGIHACSGYEHGEGYSEQGTITSLLNADSIAHFVISVR